MQNTLIFNPPFSTFRFFVLSRFSLKVFWVVSFLSIFSLLVIYIFQVNVLVSQIHTLKNYEKQIVQLSQENKILEINFSKANSLNNIENYLSTQNFEKASRVKYIQIRETEIVKTQLQPQ